MIIPYVKQVDTPGNQRCGAASLCMVYESFGLACEQTEIWEGVSRRGAYSTRRAQTYRLAADAIARGLAALVLQARQPWPILQAAAAAEVRVILNQRIKEGNSQGHFTVLVAIDDATATIHDPQAGPDQALTREALLDLWKPTRFRSEITGHVLVAIGTESLPARVCAACSEAIPASWNCRVCSRDVRLQPASVLGCTAADCAGRLWDFLYCPFCDFRTPMIS
jgi:hypothetical protein